MVQPLDQGQGGISALLGADTEQAALDAAVVLVADLLRSPAVGVLRSRSEHLRSAVMYGQDHYQEPLFAEALSHAEPRLGNRHQFTSLIPSDRYMIPILMRDGDLVLGTIITLSSVPMNASDEAQLAILELAFARTIQRIRRLSETRLLYQISLRLGNKLDFNQLVREVLELATQTFAARACRVFLSDKRAEELEMLLTPISSSPTVQILRIAREGSIADAVINSGESLILNDSTDGRFSEIEHDTGMSVAKLICVPLKQDDRPLGALMLINQHDDPDFLEEDQQLLSTIASIVAIMMANARLYRRAVRDALTGAFNRGAFEQRLREHWTNWEQIGVGFTLLILDLDNFKQINDRFGHMVGDAVLRKVTRYLWEAVREEDSVFRYGGEEFCTVLSGVNDYDTAALVSERLRAHLDREIVISSLVSVKISASVGVALHPSSGATDSQMLLQLADDAAYQAKRSGKNKVVITPEPPADDLGS